MKKALFDITGMTCSACSARIEKGLKKLDGVSEVSVNLLTNSAPVSYDEQKLVAAQLIHKIESLGFNAAEKSQEKKKEKLNIEESSLLHTQSMKRRLIISAIFTAPLFYISMGEMVNWPLPVF